MTNFTCVYFDVVFWDWPGCGFGCAGPFLTANEVISNYLVEACLRNELDS